MLCSETVTEESDFETISREVDRLKKQLNRQNIFLGVLSVLVLLLLILSFMDNPGRLILMAIVAIIIIPIGLIVYTLEKQGL